MQKQMLSWGKTRILMLARRIGRLNVITRMEVFFIISMKGIDFYIIL